MSRPLLPVDDDLRLINALLLSAPAVLVAPPGCISPGVLVERQRKTAGDMLIRAEYVIEELHRQGGPPGAGEEAGRALESGVAALREFIDRLKPISTVSLCKNSGNVKTTPKAAPTGSTAALGADGAEEARSMGGASGIKSGTLDAFLVSLEGDDGRS